MNICFVLPQMLRKPIGGYKIIYEYANRLCSKDHRIYILYLNENALSRFPMPQCIRNIAIYYFTQYEPKWFELDKRIRKLSSTNNIKDVLRNIDVAVATGADTVYKTIELFPESNKLYFIQGHETWLNTEEKVNKTYSLGLKNIVISGWLKDIVNKYSKEPALLLSNPIDIKKYQAKEDIEFRNKYNIGVLYHDAEHKGFKYAYEAIKNVKEVYPDIRLYMFGTSKPNFKLLDWIEFKLNATQEETIEIYNKVSIFVCATITEGFGLTGLEAMACGVALVSTDYDGVREYAVHGQNALLSPIQDVSALTENIKKVIMDKDLRMKLAKNGVSTAKGFSWENAVDIFEKFIQG